MRNAFSNMVNQEMKFLCSFCENNDYEYIFASDGMNSMLANVTISEADISKTNKSINRKRRIRDC